MATIPKLLTPQEAADILRISVATVKSWLSKRDIPRVKIGGKLLVKEETIAQLVEDGTQEAWVVLHRRQELRRQRRFKAPLPKTKPNGTYTWAEAQQLVSHGYYGLDALRKEGRITAVKEHGKWRVDAQSVNRYLEEERRQAEQNKTQEGI